MSRRHRISMQLATLIAVCFLAVGCASPGVTRVLTPNDRLRDEMVELKERILELQRQATVNEVELARLRDQVTAVYDELAVLRAREQTEDIEALPPPVERRPPPPVIEQRDLPPPESVRREPDRAASIEIDERGQTPAPRVEPASSEPAEGTAPSREAQQLYDDAYTLYHQSEYVEAETHFQRFLQQFGDTDLADNALYWIGESRYSRADYRGALAAFREVVNRFPRGNKVADALLKAGTSLEQLGDFASARQSYREVERRFPGSASALVAAERIDRLPQ